MILPYPNFELGKKNTFITVVGGHGHHKGQNVHQGRTIQLPAPHKKASDRTLLIMLHILTGMVDQYVRWLSASGQIKLNKKRQIISI
jgi:hypothetical protein